MFFVSWAWAWSRSLLFLKITSFLNQLFAVLHGGTGISGRAKNLTHLLAGQVALGDFSS